MQCLWPIIRLKKEVMWLWLMERLLTHFLKLREVFMLNQGSDWTVSRWIFLWSFIDWRSWSSGRRLDSSEMDGFGCVYMVFYMNTHHTHVFITQAEIWAQYLLHIQINLISLRTLVQWRLRRNNHIWPSARWIVS